mgnify:CR=1 FL=1
MSQGGYIAIAIAIIVALAAFFFVTFIWLRRMPVPKGCEDVKTNRERCCACGESGCPVYAKYHKEGGEEE